jgi:hypothetical protein
MIASVMGEWCSWWKYPIPLVPVTLAPSLYLESDIHGQTVIMTLIGDVGDRSGVADVDLKLILNREDAPRCQRIRGYVSSLFHCRPLVSYDLCQSCDG